jgi:hypothetical protein
VTSSSWFMMGMPCVVCIQYDVMQGQAALFTSANHLVLLARGAASAAMTLPALLAAPAWPGCGGAGSDARPLPSGSSSTSPCCSLFCPLLMQGPLDVAH